MGMCLGARSWRPLITSLVAFSNALEAVAKRQPLEQQLERLHAVHLRNEGGQAEIEVVLL